MPSAQGKGHWVSGCGPCRGRYRSPFPVWHTWAAVFYLAPSQAHGEDSWTAGTSQPGRQEPELGDDTCVWGEDQAPPLQLPTHVDRACRPSTWGWAPTEGLPRVRGAKPRGWGRAGGREDSGEPQGASGAGAGGGRRQQWGQGVGRGEPGAGGCRTPLTLLSGEPSEPRLGPTWDRQGRSAEAPPLQEPPPRSGGRGAELVSHPQPRSG